MSSFPAALEEPILSAAASLHSGVCAQMIRTSLIRTTILLSIAVAPLSLAQQQNPPKPQVEKTTPSPAAETPKTEEPRQEAQQPHREPSQAAASEPSHPAPAALHFDMTEPTSVVTHHQITISGRTIRYTATVGKLPIRDAVGNTDALMFYVAYTADGVDAGQRPVTFAFNGGPGSASIWLHMGALGPRKVVLLPNGFMPPAPYRFEDNTESILDKTDVVLIDAIGTGYSRPANLEAAKRFWSVKGDIEAFGEFIRLYVTRNQRWSSPLFILGESYGTTRAGGIAGYLADHGISFNGITLLSSVLNFETLEFNKTNDIPYPLILPSYTMIAAYHHKLAPDLMQNVEQTRKDAEQFAMNDYMSALNKGDALTAQERQNIIDKLARYTGLSKEVIEWANLRIDVQVFTHYLLADQKLRVGRLDGRYSGPDPDGFMNTRFYDPASSATEPPFTSAFYEYLGKELNYKTDTPYYVSARSAYGEHVFDWNWGSAGEGFPDTASALRQAIVKDRYLKILVMEGYYDLATPYLAANYTMDHLDLPEQYRKNISYATYDSGHMVYLNTPSLKKMHDDVDSFMNMATSTKQ